MLHIERKSGAKTHPGAVLENDATLEGGDQNSATGGAEQLNLRHQP